MKRCHTFGWTLLGGFECIDSGPVLALSTIVWCVILWEYGHYQVITTSYLISIGLKQDVCLHIHQKVRQILCQGFLLTIRLNNHIK